MATPQTLQRAASADGKLRVLWADSRTGIYQAWGAVLWVEREAPGTRRNS